MHTDKKINTLLIEDSPDDAFLMQTALEETDGITFDVEWVERLSLGIERLAKGGVDVVLLDLSLPDAQGLDTCSRVNASAPNVPIVVLTGQADTELSVAALRVGAQDYLIKGEVEGDTLARSVRYAIERKRAEVQLRESLVEKQALLEEIQQLYSQEHRRADQFRVIGEVGRRLSSFLDVDDLLNQIVAVLQETFHYYHVGMGMIEGDVLDYRVGAGVLWDNPDFEFPASRLRVREEGITGWVAATGEAVLAPDVTKNPHYIRMPHSDTLSELTVPIRAGGDVIGVLDVQSDKINDFDESDLVLLQSLADQVGIVIQNAQLFEESGDMAVIGERNRMAREIHDTLAQGFTGIVLQLEAAEQAYEEGETDITEHLAKAKGLARECLQEARRSVWNLMPHALEGRSLETALQDEVRRFASAGQETATFDKSGDDLELAPAIQTALLRICQESLNNIRKHAGAKSVHVCLEINSDTVTLRVQDDGIGIDPDRFEQSRSNQGGFGLMGMEQRCLQLKGSLLVHSEPGHGTTVEAVIPVTRVANGPRE